MQRSDSVAFSEEHNGEHLGVIICKECGNVIDTLDTNGVKTYYGQCETNVCSTETEK